MRPERNPASLARSERFELPTLGFEVRCSIQLSYERLSLFNGSAGARFLRFVGTENDRQKYFWLVSDIRLAQRRLGDPSLVLQLKLQFFNHLSKAFSREGICGLQGEPTSLLQFPLKCLAPHACHFRAPVFRTGSRKFSQTVSRFVNSALFNLTDAACYLFYFCS